MIERKKKKCKSCGKEEYIFSKGDCKQCAQKRYAENARHGEAKTYTLKRKAISKTPTVRHKKNKEEELAAMIAFWEEHSDFDGSCRCSECGKWLLFDRTHVAHILSKGSFPQYRCEPKNFIILCLEHHDQFDCVDRTDMKVWPYCEIIIQELKIAA